MNVQTAYSFALWLHIAAIISWMAGILYLYRLLIYHTEHRQHQDISALLEIMEGRLYRYITMPAMGVSYLAGFTMLALQPAWLSGGWLHIKLLSVAGLTVSTVYAGRIMRRFANEADYQLSSRTLRILNEVPTVFMLVIIWMVVFKPFMA